MMLEAVDLCTGHTFATFDSSGTVDVFSIILNIVFDGDNKALIQSLRRYEGMLSEPDVNHVLKLS